MRNLLLLTMLLPGVFGAACAEPLPVGVYITAHQVAHMFGDAPPAVAPAEVVRRVHASKVFLEVYRGGLVVEPEVLTRARDYFEAEGMAVIGGIATVPGEGFGVQQQGPLAWYSWFDWTAKKTQDDLKAVMRAAAPLFDTFIIDDFLATANESPEANAARGDKDWGTYRRDLLTRLCTEVFIAPAREANPGLRMIVKFPQWYDRFEMFGYAPAEMAPQFDAAWVGTESRGMRTKRFGFVPAYQGYVNFRWVNSAAGGRVEGGWFDHGDCDGADFLDQAYVTLLAGAPELTIFEYGSVETGHPGHALFHEHYERLSALRDAVQQAQPKSPIAAYKPANSAAGPDMFLMDYIGMFGIPIDPVATLPRDADSVFFPAQAAHDPLALALLRTLSEQAGPKRAILTTGFVHAAGAEAAALAGVALESPELAPAHVTLSDGSAWRVAVPMRADGAKVLLASAEGAPLITARTLENGAVVAVVNVATFTEQDYLEAEELLLAPTLHPLLEATPASADALRRAFGVTLPAWPALVSLFPVDDSRYFVYNFRNEAVALAAVGDAPALTLPPRSGDYWTGNPFAPTPSD